MNFPGAHTASPKKLVLAVKLGHNFTRNINFGPLCSGRVSTTTTHVHCIHTPLKQFLETISQIAESPKLPNLLSNI